MVKINTEDDNYGFYSGDYYDPLQNSDFYDNYVSKAQGKKHPGDQGDPIPFPHGYGKDKDKDKNNKDRKYAVRKLVRNEKGLLEVRYVDPKTGKPIKGPLRDYKILSSETELKDILKESGLKTGKPDKTKKRSDKDEYGYYTDDKGRVYQILDPYGNPIASKGAKTSNQIQNESGTLQTNSTSPPNQSGFTTPVEQGDTTGYPDIETGGPSRIPSDSTPKSLDTVDYQYTQGNNPHPMEGVNLNEVDQTVTNRNYTPEEKEHMARTLAGELDTRFTDINSEEGLNEIGGILSTMENRDLANGPNKSITDAIDAKNAYSTWNTEEQANTANKNYENNKDFYDKAVEDYLNDPASNKGFTNYYNDSLVDPAWAGGLQEKSKIGPHTFGIDPAISKNIQKGPLSQDQINQIATDIVNQNFKQGFSYPASEELSVNPPTIDTTGVQTSDMASGMRSQRDYVGPVSVAPSSMAQGLQAQRDYVAPQQITENVTGSPTTSGTTNPVDTINNQVSMDNGFTNTMGQQISSTAPTIGTNIGTNRSLPSSVNIGGQIYTPEEEVTANPSAVVENSRMGPDISNLDSRMSGDLNKSPAGVYGDPTSGLNTTTAQDPSLGFGDYVTTDPNAANGKYGSFALEVAEAKINDQVAQNNQPTIDAGLAMSANAPTVSTAESVASQTASTDPTSAGAGPGASSVTSGISTEASGGFAETPDSTSTTNSTSTSGTTSVSGTSGFVDTDTEDSGDDGY